jgi:hypothetical protein
MVDRAELCDVQDEKLMNFYKLYQQEIPRPPASLTEFCRGIVIADDFECFCPNKDVKKSELLEFMIGTSLGERCEAILHSN